MVTYCCDMCGFQTDISDTFKLLGYRYCSKCIGAARRERREQLAPSQKKKREKKREAAKMQELAWKLQQEQEQRDANALAKRQEQEQSDANALAKRIAESEARSVSMFRARIKEFGLPPLRTENLPFRLKRNEQVYFVAGFSDGFAFEIALALTNNRMFYLPAVPYSRHDPYDSFLNDVDLLAVLPVAVVPGIRTVPLPSIIALDEPIPDTNYRIWATDIHFANGTRIVLKFSSCDASREFYSVIAELVDRLNDPINESAFTPSRERIPDEVKVAVWRRDGGVCVKCGSRNNLEYDHIIPLSKGGSNTVRNIELLCQACNRIKSDKIV